MRRICLILPETADVTTRPRVTTSPRPCRSTPSLQGARTSHCGAMSDEGEGTRSLRERMFPPAPARDGRILRADLVTSWESQLIGAGRLARFLTERLLRQTHAPDDMGLNLVFLQRHRVEVGLKLVLERAGGPPMGTHSLSALFAACGQACGKARSARQWTDFADSQREFVELIDEVDPLATTFRFPVDRQHREWRREQLVDLEELEDASGRFEAHVHALIAQLAWTEPLPVSGQELEQTAVELVALINGCRDIAALQDQAMGDLQGQVDRLSALRGRRPPDRAQDSYAAAASVQEVTRALAERAQQMLDRLLAVSEAELPPPPEPRPALSLPRVEKTSDPDQLRERMRALMQAFAAEFAARVAPLTRAVDDVAHRSSGWNTPAARQLHLDVVRFKSRLMNEMRLEDPARSA